MNTTTLENLLAEGKTEEARAELAALLATELSEEERADVLMRFTNLVLQMQTALDEQYSAALQAGIDYLTELDKVEAEVDRTDKLDGLRKDILGK